jgi:5-methylcytosine-specific restriction protein A
MRLCRCGDVVKGKCPRCDGKQEAKSTSEKGYDGRWKALSKTYRAREPLCEVCKMKGYVRGADHVHHIVPVAVDWSLRLQVENLISVCEQCHIEIEGKGDPRREAPT